MYLTVVFCMFQHIQQNITLIRKNKTLEGTTPQPDFIPEPSNSKESHK